MKLQNKREKLSYRHEMFWLEPSEKKASNWLFYLRSKFCVSSWETKKNNFFPSFALFIRRRCKLASPYQASTYPWRANKSPHKKVSSSRRKPKNHNFLKNFSIRIKLRHYRCCDFSERCCSKILSYIDSVLSFHCMKSSWGKARVRLSIRAQAAHSPTPRQLRERHFPVRSLPGRRKAENSKIHFSSKADAQSPVKHCKFNTQNIRISSSYSFLWILRGNKEVKALVEVLAREGCSSSNRD